jgi:cellulose synthase/poly-beta-1,6-N-acetylglucosamine synthase-like glycosyltransferase
MSNALIYVLDYCNALIFQYFVLANVVYTALMIISLYVVSLHSRLTARQHDPSIQDSPTTPPVALIVPAYNEAGVIEQTVDSLLALEYPEKEIIVVDDGSTDGTVDVLRERFQLVRLDVIYRQVVPANRPIAFYQSLSHPELVVVRKQNGGKPDALNVGINLARSPYFCTVDADSVIERQALLRLVTPVIHSQVPVIVSGGLVRIANGCDIEKGHIAKIDLPKSWIERCQTVEYIRTFFFGRPAWNFLNATFITSGAFCLLDREATIAVGGFSKNTVTEDTDVIANLHKHMRAAKRPYRIVFSTDPICWTICPRDLRMLGRQRRRWQLGLIQTVMRHDELLFNPRYGALGLFSVPFHAYVEGLGSVLEALGYVLVPLAFVVGTMPLPLLLLFLFLAVGYGALLSVSSVFLEDITLLRYPSMRHLAVLVGYAIIENLGYRQLMTLFRAQGVLQYFRGAGRWETVTHKGVPRVATSTR